MCVIMSKPKGVGLPPKKTLEQCFEKNPDGAGFMYPTSGSVLILKGYQSADALYEAIQSQGVDWESVPLVVHFRISTQGGANPKLTHPFPVSSSYADMTKTAFWADVAVAHNGIIKCCSDSGEKRWNDTMKWVKTFAEPVIGSDPKWYEDEGKRNYFKNEQISGTSKFAIMSSDGHVEHIGKFYKRCKCLYSNLYWVPFKPMKSSKIFIGNYNYFKDEEDISLSTAEPQYFDQFTDDDIGTTEEYDDYCPCS